MRQQRGVASLNAEPGCLKIIDAARDTSIFDTKIVFESRQEARLEMADLLARESMKELDRKIVGLRPKVRTSRVVLDETRKFHFIEHDRGYCERWRARVDQPESQAMADKYRRWIHNTGRVQNGRPHDNMMNRILFYSWVENRGSPVQNVR